MDITRIGVDGWQCVGKQLTFSDVASVARTCRTLATLVQKVWASKWVARIVDEGLAPAGSLAIRWVYHQGTHAAGLQTYIALRAIAPAIKRGSDFPYFVGYAALPPGAICQVLTTATATGDEFGRSAWPLLDDAERELCVPTINQFKRVKDYSYYTRLDPVYNDLALRGWAKTLADPTATLRDLFAVLSGPAIACFVEAGADLSRIPEALHAVVRRDDASEVVPALLALQPVLDHRNYKGLSALESVIIETRSYDDAAFQLLEQLHLAGVPGLNENALDLLTGHGSPEMIRFLHRLHAWVPGQRNAKGETALHRVCARAFEFESSVHPRQKLCTQQFHRLAEGHFEECVRLLVSLGEDIEALDNNGRPPLNSRIKGHVPCSTGELLSLFESLNANFNVVSLDGSSLWHDYTKRHYYGPSISEEVAILKRRCAHALLADEKGRRPIHHYAKRLISSFSMDSHLPIIQGLVDAGEVLSLQTQKDQMPLPALTLIAALLGKTELLGELLTLSGSEVYKYGPNQERQNSLLKRSVQAFQLESVRCILNVTGDRYLTVDGTRDDNVMSLSIYNPEMLLVAKEMIALILAAKGESVTADDQQRLHIFLDYGRVDLFEELFALLPEAVQESYFSKISYFDYFDLRALAHGDADGVVAVCTYMHTKQPSWMPKIAGLVHAKYPDLLDRVYKINPAWFQVDNTIVYRIYDPFRTMCGDLVVGRTEDIEASLTAIEKMVEWDSQHRAALKWRDSLEGLGNTVFALSPEHRKRLYAAVLRPTAFSGFADTSAIKEIVCAFAQYALGREHWLELKPYIEAAFKEGTIGRNETRRLLHTPWVNTRTAVGTEESTAVMCEIITYLCSKDPTKELFYKGTSSPIHHVIEASQYKDDEHQSFYEAVIRTLIACGFNLEAVNDVGHTPLEVACQAGNVPAFRFLLSQGAVWAERAAKLVTLATTCRNFEMMLSVRRLVGPKVDEKPEEPPARKVPRGSWMGY